MKLKKLVALVMALAMIVSMGAISAVSAGEAEGSDTFTWIITGDITSLDPVQAYDDITNTVVNQITEGLLAFDTTPDSNLVCNLAESFEIVDELTYVYTLKEGLVFSDGNPVTIEDAIWSVERHMDPENASLVGWMFDCVESIEITGENEITVKLAYPDATWKYVLGTVGGHVIEKAAYEADGSIIGTNAYKLEQRVTGSQIILTKNEYSEKTADFDKVIYNIIGEDTTRVEALSTGQADFSLNPPFDMMEQLYADENVSVNMFDTYGFDFLAMNTKKAPFDDVNVRRAIACAIDVQTIYDALLVDICGPSTGLPFSAALYASLGDTAEWAAYAESYNKYTYDVEQAKAYLAESAYPDGFECTISVPESSILNSEALFMQATLAEIGINASINKMPQNDIYAIQQGFAWDAETDSRDFDLCFCTWYADYPDAAGNLVPNYLSANEAPGGCNVSGYANEKVDELLIAQGKLTDNAERGALCKEALDIIGDEVPVVIIDYPRQGALEYMTLEDVLLNASYMWNMHVADMHRK